MGKGKTTCLFLFICYSFPLFYPCFLSLSILLLPLPSSSCLITIPAPSLLLPCAPSHQPHQEMSRSRLSPAASGAPTGSQAGNAELPPAPARAAAPQKQLHAALTARAFRLHRGQADTGIQHRAPSSPRGTGALIQLLLIIPAQLARTKRYFLLNQQGQAVHTRDPPDFQELCVNAWPQPLREGCGQGQEHRMGKAFEESC